MALSLPSLVVGPPDVVRLRRELEALDDFLREAALRKGGTSVELPKLSRMLSTVCEHNKLNLLHEDHRAALKDGLDDMIAHAPVVHVSFAADPSSAFTAKVVSWFRENIDPALLLQIGLQPTIAAGCVVRTPNHYYDFSLRQFFAQQKPLLIEKLEEKSPA